MTFFPKIQLSRLREIGWKLWDPIGLAHDGNPPEEGCEDEYDRHLLHVASMISRGGSIDEATVYLTHIASEHMGLSVVKADAAAATANAIADYLTSLRDGPTAVPLKKFASSQPEAAARQPTKLPGVQLPAYPWSGRFVLGHAAFSKVSAVEGIIVSDELAQDLRRHVLPPCEATSVNVGG